MEIKKHTKNSLISSVYEKSDLQLKDIRSVVNSFVACLIECLEAGDTVEIRGLGVFSTEKRGGGGRQQFNFQEKKVMEMPETSSVVFTPGKNLKKSVNKKGTLPQSAINHSSSEKFDDAENNLDSGAFEV